MIPADSTAIDNTNRNFKGQHAMEAVVCFCRKHWIVLLPHFAGIFAAGVGLFVLYKAFSQNSAAFLTLPFAAAVFTCYLHYFFIRIFHFYLQIIIVTNYRVVELDQTLYFRRSKDSIDLHEIQDISLKQDGVLKTIFNYGELFITLSSSSVSKSLSRVPNPEYHFRKINTMKREYLRQRAMEKRGT